MSLEVVSQGAFPQDPWKNSHLALPQTSTESMAGIDVVTYLQHLGMS